MLEAWWRKHGFPPVPMQLLPPLGVIFDNKAAGWVYMDNGGTGFAMMEWLVTDPQGGIKAVRAMEHVVTFLLSELKELGYGFVFTSCRQEMLAKFLVKRGFVKTDAGMTHLVATLQ